ncbi:methyl-accepting chemotaxis protein [Leisingera sp. ANG-Vp]|uniref:methyl-accepting chemotaxis protein n=1 Tax=Leisingera sp. ANG-Vp TaxID=1577896 RepID=UPI00057E145B|nr:methyl-accepting chemotaxis protein [Leisingera sp. ANG-Vp]KIC22630.1 hypothetical protein RA20_01825 [Leisingera sp. ANG-Vp]
MSETESAEAFLSQLINQSGKMRMLSHRTVMLLLLCRLDAGENSEPRRQLGSAIEEFEEIAARLLPEQRKQRLPEACDAALSEVRAVTPDQEALLSRFLTEAKQLEQSVQPGQIFDDARVKGFSSFVANDLLAGLNSIVAGVGRALEFTMQEERQEVARNAEVVADTMDRIEKISQTVFMIALNASLEAARAGDAGRSFSTIATEIRELSKSAKETVQDLRNQISV